jgi:hypothetical protein
METPVAALLLITASVLFACIVVDYAINVMNDTVNGDLAGKLVQFENSNNNIFNQYMSNYESFAQPTPSPQPPP